MKEWLKEGKQSFFSESIIKNANNLQGRNEIGTIYNIANFSRSLKHRETQSESWESFFAHHMKRSADEVLSSGYTIDCMEVGLLTATMARSLGIPVKIVQTVDIYSYLEVEDPESNFAGSGHVYLEFYTKDKCRYFTNPGKTMVPIINKDSHKII